MAEEIGDRLARYHRPDETAAIRAQSETGIKRKWESILLDPDYESGRWGGGRGVWEEWLKNPDTVDLEFRGQVGNFLLEKFGVGSLAELREFGGASMEEFSSFENTCQRILNARLGNGKNLLTGKEKGLLGLQIKNLALLRDKGKFSKDPADFTINTQYLFDCFLGWLGKESSPSPELIEQTHHKVRQYFGVEKMEPEKIKPKPVVRQRPVPPVGIEVKQVQKAEEMARQALAKMAAIREEEKKAKEKKKEEKSYVGKVLLTGVPDILEEEEEGLRRKEERAKRQADALKRMAELKKEQEKKKPLVPKVYFVVPEEEQGGKEREAKRPMVFVWDLDKLENPKDPEKGEKDKIAVEHFCRVWRKMAEGVEGKKIKKRFLRVNSGENGEFLRLYLEVDYIDGTKDWAFITKELFLKASIEGDSHAIGSGMGAERLGAMLGNKKIAFRTFDQKEPVFLPKEGLRIEVAQLKQKEAPIPVPADVFQKKVEEPVAA